MDSRDVAEAIAEQKARYCRLLDTRRWDAFARLFDEAPLLTFVDPDGTEVARFDSQEQQS